MKTHKKISRRSFLKTGSSATAAASMIPPLVALSAKKTWANATPSPLNHWPGRVVVNYNNTHNATPTSGTTGDETILKKMVDDAIKLLTDKTSVGEAWKSLFPTLTLSTRIAIKINILNRSVPPHPFVVMGITQGLMQMNIGGSNLPASNITLYDMNNGNSMDSAGFTSSRFPGMGRVKDSRSNHGDGAANNQPYANTLANSDYLINVPGIRGHSSWAGSATLGYKSHYGTYAARYHDSSNGPGFLRDINCTGPIYNKNVLTLFGAIYGLQEGNGPGGSPVSFINYATKMVPSTSDVRPNTIILSTDPVTAEFQAKKVHRLRDNKGYTITTMPSYLWSSAGLTASPLKPVYNIGILNEAQMDYREIINSEITSPSIDTKPTVNSTVKGKVYVFPNPVRSHAFVDIITPEDFSGDKARVEIYNIRGKLVKRIDHAVPGIRSRVIWDGRDAGNRLVSNGKYIVKAFVGTRTLQTYFTVVK
jgi:hypothetical protein